MQQIVHLLHQQKLELLWFSRASSHCLSHVQFRESSEVRILILILILHLYSYPPQHYFLVDGSFTFQCHADTPQTQSILGHLRCFVIQTTCLWFVIQYLWESLLRIEMRNSCVTRHLLRLNYRLSRTCNFEVS